MDDREDLFEDERSNGRLKNADFLAEANRVLATTFPFLTEGHIEAILKMSALNGGVILVPFPEPKVLFAYYRFYPQLIEAIDDQDFDTLLKYDLTKGPFLYIAAYIAPPRLAGPLFRASITMLNPPYFAFHRLRKDGEFSFVVRKNMRFKDQPLKAGGEQ